MKNFVNSSFLLSIFCSIAILQTVTSIKRNEEPSLNERFQEEINKDQDFKKSLNEHFKDNFERHLIILSQTKINRTTNTTVSTSSRPSNTTKTISKNQTKSKNVNTNKTENNKTSANISSPSSPQATASETNSKKSESDKKIKEMQDQQKKMESNVMAIEKEVSKVGIKIDKQMNTSLEINRTVTKALEITKNLSRKIDMNQLKTEMKLDLINKHVIDQLRNQLFLQSVRGQNDIVKQQKKVEMLNLKITEIKIRLPNSNAICGKLYNCGSCTSNPKCGWCSLTQTCVEGNEKGPIDGSCVFYDYKVCSSPRDCDAYKKCGVIKGLT